MTENYFSPNPMELRSTLRKDVTEVLRQAIIDGSLPAGAELNQAQIAEKLGISRGPVREALGQLEQEGLIRNVPYKGVYVTELTEKYIEELYSIRSALETFALSRSMERFTPQELEQLRRIIDKMRDMAQAQDAEQLVNLDLQFHQYIVELADHELLMNLWKLLQIGVRRCLHTRHQIYRSLDEVVGSHPALVEAIAARNTELASQILHDHIIEAGEQIIKHWRSQQPGHKAP
jgi:DNA-binding GntR family transcriptional regulator